MMHQRLEKWEAWPIWALGLSNGLNICLWYVLSFARIQSPELPIRVLTQLQIALPLIVVIGGVAAAVSLDGVLIATIAGMRHGRKGAWSVATILGAAVFSGAIAYAVHSGWLDQAPGLHVAQAVVLALYNLHLSQPRKTLQSAESAVVHDTEQENAVAGFRCRDCDALLPSLNDLKRHKRDDCPQRAKALDLSRVVTGTLQPNSNGHRSSVNDLKDQDGHANID